MKTLLLPGALVGMVFGTVPMPVVTYYRDVLPILQKHCLACHRPGQIAPISFQSYQETRPWADAIKESCGDGQNVALVRPQPCLDRPRSRLVPDRSRDDGAVGRGRCHRRQPERCATASVPRRGQTGSRWTSVARPLRVRGIEETVRGLGLRVVE
jgi:hypothetical protein